MRAFRWPAAPAEFKVVALRECFAPEELALCDTPDRVAAYWRMNVATDLRHNPEVETLVALILNTRRRVKGHYVVATGTMDTILVHPREVFRVAIVAGAGAIVLAHNHPSGESTPSEGDIKVTRDLMRAGQLLKIELLDHVVVGHNRHTSMRELGYFF